MAAATPYLLLLTQKLILPLALSGLSESKDENVIIGKLIEWAVSAALRILIERPLELINTIASTGSEYAFNASTIH